MNIYIQVKCLFLLIYIQKKVTSREQIDDLFKKRPTFYDPVNNPSLNTDTYKPCYGNTDQCGQCEGGFVPCLFYDAYKVWGTTDYIGCIKYNERDKCCSKGSESDETSDGTWQYLDNYMPNGGVTCRHVSSNLISAKGEECDRKNFGYCRYHNTDGTSYFNCQSHITERCEDVRNKPTFLQRPIATCITSTYGCTIKGTTCGDECKWRGHRDPSGVEQFKCSVPYDVDDSGLTFCSVDSKHTIVKEENCVGLCNKGDKTEHVPFGTYWCNIGGGDDKWNYCSPDQDSVNSQPSDCKLTGWSDWSCNVTCGDGIETRSKTILEEAKNAGKPCSEFKTIEKENCYMKDCPVDCSYTPWSSWSKCSASCGEGRQTMTREVSIPSSHGGEPCGELKKERDCNIFICPVDCTLSDWSSWSKCIGWCGTGLRTMDRHIVEHERNGGEECDQEQSKSENCTLKPCSESTIVPQSSLETTELTAKSSSETTKTTEKSTPGTTKSTEKFTLEITNSTAKTTILPEIDTDVSCPSSEMAIGKGRMWDNDSILVIGSLAGVNHTSCCDLCHKMNNQTMLYEFYNGNCSCSRPNHGGNPTTSASEDHHTGICCDKPSAASDMIDFPIMVVVIAGSVVLIVIILAIIVGLICWRKKMREEIMFVDDNPEYNYAESGDDIEVTDENPYYGAEDDDSTTDNAIVDMNDGYGRFEKDSFASTDEDETGFNQ